MLMLITLIRLQILYMLVPKWCYVTQKGFTPLLLACYYQKIGILKFLLDHDQVCEIAAFTSVRIIFTELFFRRSMHCRMVKQHST